jgi:GNAT superfamily N-acetyltransferase
MENRMRRFEIEEPSTADIEFLEDRLYEFNAGTTGISDGRSLGVFLRDEAKNIVAGVAGHTWGETCELRQVWVAASIRGRGLGRRLIAEAEAEALRRGCRQLVLATHTFPGTGVLSEARLRRGVGAHRLSAWVFSPGIAQAPLSEHEQCDVTAPAAPSRLRQ